MKDLFAPPTHNVMLDIETLDTAPTAVVVSIGAVYWNNIEGDGFKTFYRELGDYHDQVSLGRTVSENTIKWWQQQDPAAMRVMFPNPHHAERVSTYQALTDFVSWGKAHWITDPAVWGNSSAFDNVIMGNLYEDYGINRPWGFRQDRCYRTMNALFPVDHNPTDVIAHNALHDARYQAEKLTKIFAAIQTEHAFKQAAGAE